MSEELEKRELAEKEAEEFRQMQLLLGDEKLYIDRQENVGIYTGERFKNRYPERYRTAIKLIAANQFSDRTIAVFVHADYRTVEAVRLSCIEDINEQRELLRKKFFVGTVVLQEKVMELAHDCKDLKTVSIGLGIHKDAYLAVAGLPQAHLEVNHHIDLGGELSKLMTEAREAMKAAKARVVGPEELPPIPATGGDA